MRCLHLQPTDPDLLAALAAGLSWQMALDATGMGAREAAGVVRRLPLHLNNAGRLENTGFVVQCLAQTVVALQEHVATLTAAHRHASPVVPHVPVSGPALTDAHVDPPAPSTASAARRDQGAIRAWARRAGYRVADKGTVARDVVEAYRAAHTQVTP